MARISRKNQIAENLVYHIFNRGNGKLEVFHDERDYEYFLKTIKKYQSRFNFKIYHWVLMSNHFHFLISIDVPEKISKLIGAILQVYVQYHHLRWNSAGKLWQGRFRSQAVEKDNYLFECGRYIERNPMRAGIVKYPWDYKWSSCKIYANHDDANIVSVDTYYESFGENKEERVREYREWVLEKEDNRFDKMDSPVGSEDFMNRILLSRGRHIARRRGRPKSI